MMKMFLQLLKEFIGQCCQHPALLAGARRRESGRSLFKQL
jgi:hypothetical protein